VSLRSQVPPPEPSSALRTTLNSRVHHHPVLRAGPLRLDPQEQRITFNGKALRLSAEEFALCSLLIEHEGIAVAAEDMVAVVWGSDQSDCRTLLTACVERLRELFAASSARILDRDGREFRLTVVPS
jgi:DNA-binding response OmpR family regulator